METKLFFAAALLGLLLVAYSGRDAPRKKTSKPVPSFAVEVSDEALEELRRQFKTLSTPTANDPAINRRW